MANQFILVSDTVYMNHPHEWVSKIRDAENETLWKSWFKNHFQKKMAFNLYSAVSTSLPPGHADCWTARRNHEGASMRPSWWEAVESRRGFHHICRPREGPAASIWRWRWRKSQVFSSRKFWGTSFFEANANSSKNEVWIYDKHFI